MFRFFTPKTAFAFLVLSLAILAGVILYTRTAANYIQETRIENRLIGIWSGYNSCRGLRVHQIYNLTERGQVLNLPNGYHDNWEEHATWSAEGTQLLYFHYIPDSEKDLFEIATLSEKQLILHYGEWRGRYGERCMLELEKKKDEDLPGYERRSSFYEDRSPTGK